MCHGFPNLFFPGGPHGASGNNPRYGGDQCDFVADLIDRARDHGQDRIEAPAEREDAWNAMIEKYRAYSSFIEHGQYYGANVAGKPRRFLLNPGGRPKLRQMMDDVVANGYEGFLSGRVAPAGYRAHTQAIHDLITTYAQALDDGRTDDVVATFCPDGTAIIPGREALQGHDALRAAYATMKPSRPQRHVVVNTVVTAVEADTARASSDLIVLIGGSSGWVVHLVGRYTDDLRMVDADWRFETRRLEFA
jgi:uncharacterized protein (TIGR02246 family)